MGSHSKLRSDFEYKKAAKLGYELSRAGYFVVTGGGPGLMEAVHLGAWMAGYDEPALDEALKILAVTLKPNSNSGQKQYEVLDYWKKAREVIQLFPKGQESLGIPTWFYGHEGANAFSIHVAKYFSNALREEKLCAIGIHGLIFLPGGPGTAQEAFMDAAENAYVSYNWYSPMIFYSDQRVAHVMKKLISDMTTKKYGELKMISLQTKISGVLDFLNSHPPVKK